MKIGDIISEAPLLTTKMEFRDRIGVLLGTIEPYNNTLIAKDRTGRTVGTYDPETDVTRNYIGVRVGTGNLLSTLFLTFA